MIYLLIILTLSILTIFATLEDGDTGLFMGLILTPIFIPWFISYYSHASDVAIVKEQHRVVTVYKQRIESLTERLERLSQGNVTTALLNHDTPIASLIQSITNMENKIAEAEATKAEAYKDIAARKMGFTNSVTWFIDDIEEVK